VLNQVITTDSIIPAKGGPAQGAEYSYEDGSVEPSVDYWYKLEDIDVSGHSTFHGPVQATVTPAWTVPKAESSTTGAITRDISMGLGVLG